MAVGFHRSSWDWIGLYRVGAWGLLGLEGVGSAAQHCGVPSELPPTSEHGEGMELCPPIPWHHDVVLLLEALVQQFLLPPALWAPRGPRVYCRGVQGSFGSPCVNRVG